MRTTITSEKSDQTFFFLSRNKTSKMSTTQKHIICLLNSVILFPLFRIKKNNLCHENVKILPSERGSKCHFVKEEARRQWVQPRRLFASFSRSNRSDRRRATGCERGSIATRLIELPGRATRRFAISLICWESGGENEKRRFAFTRKNLCHSFNGEPRTGFSSGLQRAIRFAPRAN